MIEKNYLNLPDFISDNMKKSLFIILVLLFVSWFYSEIDAETVESLKYGDFQHWVVRKIPESRMIGGKKKTLYEIGPSDTIDGAKPYINAGGSPWATSNVFASPGAMGVHINKGSNAVFPYNRGNGNIACRMTTMFDSVKVIGMININVLVGGSIFLGKMLEPVRSTKNPYSNMDMGIPFTRRPKALQFDYKVDVPDVNTRVYSNGFSKKVLAGRDSSEVFIILQRRWEDADGNLYARRVGTGRERFFINSGWVNGHRLPVQYGDITQNPDYKPWMGLIPKEKSYYARNSKGKMVPVVEVGWDSVDAVPTHIIVMASAACGTAYVGTPGQTLYVDNLKLIY